ncbi:MAG: DUF4381 domain-containing protein [Gammaproteobacteria bacterium]
MAPDNLELRDIQLPDPVSWWPPAVGWWLVLLGIILFLIAAIFLFKKWKTKRRSAKVLARKELQKIEQEFSNNSDQKLLIENLSTLLRRSSLSSFPREECAGLTGEEWLSFLDQVMQEERFSKGIGRSLITAPYEKKLNNNSDQLLSLCKDWIEALP